MSEYLNPVEAPFSVANSAPDVLDLKDVACAPLDPDPSPTEGPTVNQDWPWPNQNM